MRRYMPMLLAGLSGVLFFAFFIGQTRSVQSSSSMTTPVIVLKSEVKEPFTAIKAEMLEVRQVPVNLVPKSFISDPKNAIGKYVTIPLPVGAPLYSGLLKESTDSRVAARIELKDGERLMGIPVDLDSSAGGQVVPGDHVDVTVVWDATRNGGLRLAKTQWQDLQVMTVLNNSGGTTPRDGTLEKGQSKNERVPTVLTLKVTIQQVEQLAFAGQYGTLYASVRKPSSTEVTSTSGFTGPALPGKP